MPRHPIVLRAVSLAVVVAFLHGAAGVSCLFGDVQAGEDGSALRIAAEATESLEKDTTVEALLLEPGATLNTNNHILTVRDRAEAAGATLLFAGKKGGLRTQGDMTFAGALRGTKFRTDINLWIDAGTLTHDGVLDGARSGEDNTRFHIADGARLYVGPNARWNQQREGMINARVIWTHGQGAGSVIEFDPDFIADHMGFPDLEAWTADGYSVLFLENATLITHATQGLPSVHKLSGNGNHTHHGVIDFYKGRDNRWLVRTASQVYDGVVSWREGLTITTEANLTLTGHYFEDSHCFFGPRPPYDQEKATRLVKDGPARLDIIGTQLYAPGAELVVREGLLALWTGPHRPGQYARAKWPKVKEWDNLRCVVEKGGTLRFRPPERVGTHIASLRSAGRVELVSGPLAVRGGMTLAAGATLVLSAPTPPKRDEEARARVEIGGALTLAGAIHLTGTPPKPGDYPLFAAATVDGSATVVFVDTEGEPVPEGQAPVATLRKGMLHVAPAAE